MRVDPPPFIVWEKSIVEMVTGSPRRYRADPTLLSYGLDRNNTEWATEDGENDG